MFNTNKLLLPTLLIIATTAVAQPSFRITSFISHRDLTDRQKVDIERYTEGWATILLTDDAKMIAEARRGLTEPLDNRWSMSNTARMHYGEALLSSFEPFLSEENENEVAAINALQILSLLGTERSVTTIMRHASNTFEDRSALRQWASAGLENSFQTGRLPLTRITSAATLLADAASKEPVWHVASRQLQSLSSLSDTPGLRRSELTELQGLSFELQVQAISNIVEDVAANKKASLRMRPVRSGLSSLRLQLIEPSVDSTLKTDTINNLVPVLIRVLEVASSQWSGAKKSDALLVAYGGAIETATTMLQRFVGDDDVENVDVRGAWEAGDKQPLTDAILYWQNKTASK
ncbi:MAG: hypothetical protein HOC93_00840 [Phycisphaerae bacterium]|jgi:hypothetical protein|nr:hypothetical protein [Phycisphaerae bacterium]